MKSLSPCLSLSVLWFRWLSYYIPFGYVSDMISCNHFRSFRYHSGFQMKTIWNTSVGPSTTHVPTLFHVVVFFVMYHPWYIWILGICVHASFEGLDPLLPWSSWVSCYSYPYIFQYLGFVLPTPAGFRIDPYTFQWLGCQSMTSLSYLTMHLSMFRYDKWSNVSPVFVLLDQLKFGCHATTAVSSMSFDIQCSSI
jgi:hypothetical protein